MYNEYEMSVTADKAACPWLLLVFSLPAKRASQRVAIWRKLQRYGMLPLGSSGYVLPNNAANLEHMEWVAAEVRAAKGQASVVKAQGFDDLPWERLKQRFQDARTRDYQKLLQDVRKVLAISVARRPSGGLNRLRRRLAEIRNVDFFNNPLHGRIETLLARADAASESKPGRKQKASAFLNRVWMTRPRPGIDRVSSAWLIRRFIDPKARFVYGADPAMNADAIPFDMFCTQGFGHRGTDCTFETLCKEFAIRDRKIKLIAEVIHDADLGDEKFGRVEGTGLDRVLNGWVRQDLPDDELLQRGMDLIEGLYESLT